MLVVSELICVDQRRPFRGSRPTVMLLAAASSWLAQIKEAIAALQIGFVFHLYMPILGPWATFWWETVALSGTYLGLALGWSSRRRWRR
jgi:hypothetical protein